MEQKAKTFNVRVFTGPDSVARVADLTGLQAGTEHAYGQVCAVDELGARKQVVARFKGAGLWTPKYCDMTAREES